MRPGNRGGRAGRGLGEEEWVGLWEEEVQPSRDRGMEEQGEEEEEVGEEKGRGRGAAEGRVVGPAELDGVALD